MNVLCVVAHPDDETLGCGGTLARHADEGDRVVVATFTDGVGSRFEGQEDCQKHGVIGRRHSEARAERHDEFKRAIEALGVHTWSSRYLTDQHLDAVPTIELTNDVAAVIGRHRSEIVYTHHPGDLNQDHRAVAQAVLIATRPVSDSTVRRVLAMEVPESTSQTFGAASQPFVPNVYVDVHGYVMESKVPALACYRSELDAVADRPHPRSARGAKIHAEVRGAEAGLDFAEAFMLLRDVVR